MKRVGIITFQRADNYGAVLQNFALLRAIKSNIPEVEINTIDYRSHVIEEPYHKKLIENKYRSLKKNIFHTIRRIIVIVPQCVSRRRFEDFRQKYLQLTESVGKNEIKKVDECFDILICGSDQVWNDRITDEDSVFSLGFSNRAKKISYAASSGNVNNISQKTLENIKQLDTISVREKSLKEYLESKINREIKVVVDPVFLLDGNAWNEIISNNRLIREKYILVYSVGDKSNEAIRLAKRISAKTGFKIVHIDLEMRYGFNSICKYAVSPLQFVQLIKESEIVVASSFHATAFSIIFRRPFLVIPSKITGDRIVDLLKLCGLENNIVDKIDEMESANWPTVYNNESLNILIEESINYLRKEIIL